jgi:hypothetical protein
MMCRYYPPPDPDDDFTEEAPRPRRATQAAPGSEEKIIVLRRRALRREELFRVGDAVDWGGMNGALVFGRSWSTWGPSKLPRQGRRQAGKAPPGAAGDGGES